MYDNIEDGYIFAPSRWRTNFNWTEFATAGYSLGVWAGNNSINTSHDTEVTSSNICGQGKF